MSIEATLTLFIAALDTYQNVGEISYQSLKNHGFIPDFVQLCGIEGSKSEIRKAIQDVLAELVEYGLLVESDQNIYQPAAGIDVQAEINANASDADNWYAEYINRLGLNPDLSEHQEEIQQEPSYSEETGRGQAYTEDGAPEETYRGEAYIEEAADAETDDTYDAESEQNQAYADDDMKADTATGNVDDEAEYEEDTNSDPFDEQEQGQFLSQQHQIDDNVNVESENAAESNDNEAAAEEQKPRGFGSRFSSQWRGRGSQFKPQAGDQEESLPFFATNDPFENNNPMQFSDEPPGESEFSAHEPRQPGFRKGGRHRDQARDDVKSGESAPPPTDGRRNWFEENSSTTSPNFFSGSRSGNAGKGFRSGGGLSGNDGSDYEDNSRSGGRAQPPGDGSSMFSRTDPTKKYRQGGRASGRQERRGGGRLGLRGPRSGGADQNDFTEADENAAPDSGFLRIEVIAPDGETRRIDVSETFYQQLLVDYEDDHDAVLLHIRRMIGLE